MPVITHRFEAVQGNVLGWFTSKVDTLNKVAAKIGNGGFTLTIEALPLMSLVEQHERMERWMMTSIEDPGRRPPWVGPTFNLTVSGTLPVVPGGWTVVAAVDHFAQEDGTYRNVVRSFEEGAVTDWMDAAPDCAHCGRSVARKYTVVIKDADGNLVQVGKSCLVDYVGHNDIDQLMNLATYWGDLFTVGRDEEDDEYYSSKSLGYPTVYSVVLALAATKAFGYGKADSEKPTREVVTSLLQPPHKETKEAHAAAKQAIEDLGGHEVVEADAKAAIAWAAGYEGHNDYLTNLRTIVTAASGGAEFTSPKHIGLLVSLAPTWNREQERKVERKVRDDAEAARRADAEDAPQERVEVEGVIVGLKTYHSDFGATEKMTVLADGGYKVWVSVPKALEAQYDEHHGLYSLSTLGATVGDRVRFTATFEQAEGDSTFAFGKRPASATFVERAEAVVKETEAFMAVRAEQDAVSA